MNSGLSGGFLAALAALTWATAIVLSKVSLMEADAVTIFTVQIVAATTCAVAVLMICGGRLAVTQKACLAYAAGICEPFLAYTLSLFGLALVPAGIVSVIFATEAVMIVILSTLLLGLSIHGWTSFLALLATAFSGVIMVILPDLNDGTGSSAIGYAAVTAGVFFAALYVVISSKLIEEIPPVELLAGQLIFCLALSVAFLMPFASYADLDPKIILIAATAGALQYYLAFHLYLMALRHIHVNVAGTMLYLIPVFTLALAYAFLGETLTPIQLTGCGIILGAVALINHRHAA